MASMKLKGTATIDDLLRMPKDGRKYELVDGEILVSPAGVRHSEIAAKIAYISIRVKGPSRIPGIGEPSWSF